MSDKDKKDNILNEFFDEIAEEFSSLDIKEEHINDLMSKLMRPKSVAATIPEKKPVDILNEHIEMSGRILSLIPFGSTIDEAKGFISILGNRSIELPVLTLCVEKPNGGSVVSSIVFPSNNEYISFAEKLYIDSVQNFNHICDDGKDPH